MQRHEYPVDIEAYIIFLSTEEGGRKGPCYSGYRPQIYYDGHDWDAIQVYPDVSEVFPGQAVRAQLSFLTPEAHVGKLYPGKEFLVREGIKVVARGTVTNVVALEESARRNKTSDG